MKLDFTDRALRSLERSLELLAHQYSVEQRRAYAQRIFEHAQLLVQFPGSGQIEENLTELGQSHRRLVFEHFKIVYFVDGDIIRITDIFDTRRDPDEMSG